VAGWISCDEVYLLLIVCQVCTITERDFILLPVFVRYTKHPLCRCTFNASCITLIVFQSFWYWNNPITQKYSFWIPVVLLAGTKEDLLSTCSPISKKWFQIEHFLLISRNYSLLTVTFRYGICGRHSGNETDFSTSNSILAVSILPPVVHSHISLIYHRRCAFLATDSLVKEIILSSL
jgi:hypothetical protein